MLPIANAATGGGTASGPTADVTGQPWAALGLIVLDGAGDAQLATSARPTTATMEKLGVSPARGRTPSM